MRISMTRAIADETARRKRDGEFDHLIAYALQSSQFTTEPKIEPAVSVKAFAQSATVPARAFESGRQSSPWIFRATGVCSRPQSGVSGKRISPRVRFLYAKEFLRQKHPYEMRGYSTDTQVAANYAVWNALSVLKAAAPDVRIRRVLIIGPGMDLAPRTELIDAVPRRVFSRT